MPGIMKYDLKYEQPDLVARAGVAVSTGVLANIAYKLFIPDIFCVVVFFFLVFLYSNSHVPRFNETTQNY